jgi:raffinose/stachyose/melibiose transport system permease protein
MNKPKLHPAKTIAALLIIALHIMPFYILINMSLKAKSDIGSRWIPPRALHFANYAKALEGGTIFQALLNTAIVTILSVIIVVIVGSMAGYPLSRHLTKANRIILALFVGIMMVPGLSVLVPLYKEIVLMKGVSTYWSIVVVSAAYNLPLSIYMYANFISTIPRELDEAAMIDGSNKAGIFFRILLPSLKPVTASVIIWTGVGIWNDYQFQLFFLQKPAMRTITLAMTKYFTEMGADLGAAAAAAVVAILPPVVMYVFLQKYFVRGVMDSAVK